MAQPKKIKWKYHREAVKDEEMGRIIISTRTYNNNDEPPIEVTEFKADIGSEGLHDINITEKQYNDILTILLAAVNTYATAHPDKISDVSESTVIAEL